jgi:hypothetical protein
MTRSDLGGCGPCFIFAFTQMEKYDTVEYELALH